MKFNDKGYSPVELVLVVVMVAVVGLVGFKVIKARQDKTATDSSNSQKQVVQEPNTATEINTAKDLDTASSDLDKLNVDQEMTEVETLEKEVNAL